jgi:DNA-binding PadR family transcriptional regulator
MTEEGEVPVLPMRPELLKGHLDALLLAVLESGPQHGYAVIESLRSGSDGALDLPTGTVYPALHRLERAGLIRSDWHTVGGRRRRAYRLTRAGRAALAEQRAVWDQFSAAVTALLRAKPATA